MTHNYTIPQGLHAVPEHLYDDRPDVDIDRDLSSPKPVSGEKNIWFFWHSGYENMHPYAQRNLRAWHRRFSKYGWVIRVIDCAPGSPANVANYLDTQDQTVFPQAFMTGTLSGRYAPQHTSDLVRFPLLLKYGGVYTDAGMMQIGDLDRLWNDTVGDPSSPWEVLAYNGGGPEQYSLMNYFMCCTRSNPFFECCHRLLLALWAEDGGKRSTDGMHTSPLLQGVPHISCPAYTENGRAYSEAEASARLSDYIIQGQAIAMVMGLVDKESDWKGPEYVRNHIYAIEYMEGSQLINTFTAWNGSEAYRLMSLPLPVSGQVESEDQTRAREIVEGCLQRSFGFKLAHGMIIAVLGETLGSLWRKHAGSDDVPGTYAHWLRYGIARWNQDALPVNQVYKVRTPFKEGPLLRVM